MNKINYSEDFDKLHHYLREEIKKPEYQNEEVQKQVGYILLGMSVVQNFLLDVQRIADAMDEIVALEMGDRVLINEQPPTGSQH